MSPPPLDRARAAARPRSRVRAASAVGAALTLAVALASPSAGAKCDGDLAAALALAKEADRERAVDVAAAIAKHKRATELAPSRASLFWRLAVSQLKAEEYAAAAESFGRAWKLDPKHAGYAAAHGTALARVAARGGGDFAAARAPLEAALSLDPNHADAHHELGDVLLHLHDDHGALVHYTRAVELAPAHAPHWAALGDLYLRLRLLEQAEQTLAASLEVVEGDAARFPLLMLLGQTLDRRGRPAEALPRFEQAKAACGACGGPGQAIVYFSLGMSYAAQSPPRRAEALQNLTAFSKMICRGAAASRYADACSQANERIARLGSAIP